MPGFFGVANSKIANSCLSTTASFGYLWLRQFAVTHYVGDDDFPVHLQNITEIRYICKRFDVIGLP